MVTYLESRGDDGPVSNLASIFSPIIYLTTFNIVYSTAPLFRVALSLALDKCGYRGQGGSGIPSRCLADVSETWKQPLTLLGEGALSNLNSSPIVH